MQSRRHSALEALANVVVGYGLAIATQALVFPAMGLSVTALQSAKIGLLFVGVSLARSYILRRVFNRLGRT